MVEAGAKEVPEEEMVQALERAHAAIKEIIAGIDALAAQAGKTKRAGRAEEGNLARTSSPRSRARSSGRSPTRCGSRTSSRTTRPSTRSSSDFVAGLSDDDAEREGRREVDRQGPEGEGPARRDPRARPAARRPQVRRDPQRSRSRSASCRARTAPACSRAARRRRSSPRRSAPPTTSRRSRRSTARRGSASCSTTTSRRSRSAKCKFLRGPGRREIGHGALAERALAADDADRREVPLHRPRRLRHPRVERLLVDGVGLRRIAGDDGCRRAAEGAGRRRRDGPGHERGDRQVRRSSRTSPAPRTTTATWTSRSPARATGITALQMDIKVARHHDRDHDARRSSRRARAGCTSSTRCRRRWRRRARTSRRTRRASSRSGFRSTRSATSSDRAAR